MKACVHWFMMMEFEFGKQVMSVFGLRQEKHIGSAHNLYPQKIVRVSKILHWKLDREKIGHVT